MLWFLIGICLQLQGYSFEKEVALGATLAHDISSRTQPVADEQVQQYATRIGMRLARFASSPFPWSFAVVTGLDTHPAHQPLAIPGGHIFIPASLVLEARSENEFAGMLAYAIAYEIARDTRRLASANVRNSYGSVPLIFLGGGLGGDNASVPLAFRTVEREIEQMADLQAIRLIQAAGFNLPPPNEQSFQTIQERLQNSLPIPKPRSPPSLLSPGKPE